VWITVTGGATVRRVAWWLLLTCTVIGLASMHTLGHGRVAGPSAHPGGGASSHVPSGAAAGSSSHPVGLAAGSPSHLPVGFAAGSPSHLPVGFAAGSFSYLPAGLAAGSFSHPSVGSAAGFLSGPSSFSYRSVHSFAPAPAGLRSGGILAGPHPDDHGSGGGHGAAWGVCLAVLVALTVSVLLSACLLLRRRGGRDGSARAFSAGGVISRGPPRHGAGLRLAAISVMRI
jgi:hypothetical protein